MRFNILCFSFVFLYVTSVAQNWTIIDTSKTHVNAALRSAFFTDDSTGYVVGGWSGVAGVILKTTNAGISWDLQTVNADLECVYFPTKEIGYAVGKNRTILKTIDAGITWEYQQALSVSSMYTAMSVCFFNKDTGFVGLKNGPGYAFLKTYNGGTTWINDISDTVNANVFFKLNENSMCGIFGKFSKTNDKGATWINYEIPQKTNISSALFFINDSIGFATIQKANGIPCFNYSSLIKTNDGGQTWNETEYNCDYVDGLYFPSKSIGYMIGGFIGSPYSQKVWKTIDGGNTWLYTTFQLDSFLTSINTYGWSIICTDTNICYILTNYGTIIKTTNGFGNVGINENPLKTDNYFNIFPNPTTNYFTITTENDKSQPKTVNIYSIDGLLVKSESYTGNEIRIETNDLSAGIFVVELITNKGSWYKKVVVTK